MSEPNTLCVGLRRSVSGPNALCAGPRTRRSLSLSVSGPQHSLCRGPALSVSRPALSVSGPRSLCQGPAFSSGPMALCVGAWQGPAGPGTFCAETGALSFALSDVSVPAFFVSGPGTFSVSATLCHVCRARRSLCLSWGPAGLDGWHADRSWGCYSPVPIRAIQ